MPYESIAARFLLALTALLWASVLCAAGPVQPDVPNDQETPLNIVPASSPKTSSRWSPWLGLNDDLLSCICQFYGPIRFNASDRQNIGKVLKVLTTLSRLFEDLEYVGTIEVDEVLAYYPVLSELSHVKKRYPHELGWKLMNWPLPKENLTLSLLISIGSIAKSTLWRLTFHHPHMLDKPARLAAVNYCLDNCTEGMMYIDDIYYRIMLSASEPCVVHKLKQISHQIISLSAVVSGSLLHFAPEELGEALVDELKKALAIVARVAKTGMFAKFWSSFIRYPTTLRDSNSRQDIFERNVQEFQAIPFSDEQGTALSVVNKIKFGAVQEIKDMSEAERKALFDMFRNKLYGKYALVFHIWAREDVEKDGGWETFANDRSNTSILSRLAFGLEGFFQNNFKVDLACDKGLEFCYFLDVFNDYPSSSKKKRFHELLRSKVQEHPGTILALSCNRILSNRLVDLFIDQGDKEGLMALNAFVSQAIIDGSLHSNLDDVVEHNAIIWGCQFLHGRVDGGDPLQLLAKHFGAAAVLRRLDFSRLRANDVGGMLRTLDIAWERMNVALLSLSHNSKPVDELAAVLRGFQHDDRNLSRSTLPKRHSLWFYLWKEHRAAFVEHVHPKIQQHYLPEELKLPKSVRRLASGLWR